MSDPVSWDAGLIRSYDKAGPLYTAYPTLAQYYDGILPADLFAALKESSRLKRPLSLYVHIPFCANTCHYCYCTRVITKDRSRAEPYLKALYREIDLISEHVAAESPVTRLHLGGGTPTFLSHSDLSALMAKLRSRFSLNEDDIADYSIEVDPREADWSTLGLLRELGFNHVSFGVQDLDPEVQYAVNRLQSLEQTQAVMDAARALAYRSVNMDLICGLPRQTPESFTRTLERVIAMKPDRLTLRNYTHLPEQYPPQRHIEAQALPSEETRLQIHGNSQQQLLDAGYRFIGMGQFALPDDNLSLARETGMLSRGLQGYIAGVECDLIGLGVSAISQVGNLYCRNSCDLQEYQQHLEQGRLPLRQGLKCSADDRLRRVIIQQLMCQFKLRYADLEQRFNIDFAAYFADCMGTLRQMHEDGLINLSAHGIEVLPVGKPLLARICMVFDAYQHATNGRRYASII
ncbi:MAG: oxygen-independent coproporphyrinogen III oxidase [Pseudomonas sp.]